MTISLIYSIVVLCKDRDRNNFFILLDLDWQSHAMSVEFTHPTGARFGEVISVAILKDNVDT